MARLTTTDKQILEQLFQMGSGYVLNFSDKTFAEFFSDALNVDISDTTYRYASGSKANRLRGFWLVAEDALVARSIEELLTYIDVQIDLGRLRRENFPDTLIRRAREITARLLKSTKPWSSAAKEGTTQSDPGPAAVDTQKAFISYCREDTDFARKLAQDLRAGGAAVWLDVLDIKPGTAWDNAIEEALASCSRLLVILSPASVSSQNVQDEVAYGLDKQKMVIPLFYRECEVPLRWRRLQYIDFRTDYDGGRKILLQSLGVYAPAQADYAIGRGGDSVTFLSERSTRRGRGPNHATIGHRIVFRTKHDTARFVEASESEGFTFEGKEFIAGP